jgi:hypothetical protein
MTAASPARSTQERRALLDKLKAALVTPIRAMTIAAVTIGFIVPVAGILAFGKRAT